jgi:hypothetical protein
MDAREDWLDLVREGTAPSLATAKVVAQFGRDPDELVVTKLAQLTIESWIKHIDELYRTGTWAGKQPLLAVPHIRPQSPPR